MSDPRWWKRAPVELWGLTTLAFATRFWRLSAPGGRVWDEIYFQEYASRYFTGSYYFDVHPPLTKLLFALVARLMRVPPEYFMNGTGITAFRVLPALTGALLVPLVWWLVRECGGTRRVAAFGAALVLMDNALLVQSRLALSDMPLLFFGIAAVTCLMAARRMAGGARWALLSLAALLGGCAAATKWTGLTALGLIGATWLIDIATGLRRTAGDGGGVPAVGGAASARDARRPVARWIGEGALLLVLPAAVYFGSFVVHLRLLPNDGPGTGAMSRAFNETRRGHPAYTPDAKMGTVAQIAEIHRVAMETNLGWSTLQHVAASKWYTWPVSKHRIMLWKDSLAAPGTEARMDIQGNPALWYGILVAMGAFVVLLAMRRVEARTLRAPMVWLGAAYVMNFVPFAFIARPMYLYHYNFALVFSIVLASLAMGAMCGWQKDDGAPWRLAAGARRWYLGTLLLVAVSFAYFAPLSYGTALSTAAAAQRRWVLERQ